LSKPLTLGRKIKLFRMYLKQRQDAVVVDCPFCKSINIHFCEQEEVKENNKVIYVSRYLCNDCYSACENRQDWFKG
jgi:transposase-like protein